MFPEIDERSSHQPEKVWVESGNEFYSKHNIGRSLIIERFIRTLKIKTYKCSYFKEWIY